MTIIPSYLKWPHLLSFPLFATHPTHPHLISCRISWKGTFRKVEKCMSKRNDTRKRRVKKEREELTIEKFLKLNYAPTLIISSFLSLLLILMSYNILMSLVITPCFYLYWIPLLCLLLFLLQKHLHSLLSLSCLIFLYIHPLILFHFLRELHQSEIEQMISYLAFLHNVPN